MVIGKTDRWSLKTVFNTDQQQYQVTHTNICLKTVHNRFVPANFIEITYYLVHTNSLKIQEYLVLLQT